MRIRATLFAATIASIPVLAFAQTAPSPTTPVAPPSAANPPSGPASGHHDRAARHQRHAEMKAKYAQLSAADKAKFDDLRNQIKSLRQQQMQILGMSKS